MKIKILKKISIIILLIICLFFNMVKANTEDEEDININEILQVTSAEVDMPKASSRIALIYDRASGEVIYEKNGYRKAKMASTTKIMTSLIVLEKGNLSDTVTVSKKAAGTGGSRLGLKTNDKITVNDLLMGLMLESGNDAAIALAEHISGGVERFADLMNAKAKELGLKEGTPITYRAGDQPNNALSLNVFNPGEIASTAGTSGVVYGVNGEVNYDPKSRVNTFAHVNHTDEQTRLGVLLCINGTGILNSWVKRTIAPEGISYNEMNVLASQAPIGSAGISILPFGNGAERMLENKEINCSIRGLNFNLHSKQHIVRAAQEGIVFSFKYGIDIMEGMGIPVQKIHAGHANMFLSPIFRDTLAGVTGAVIELYDTDGSVGAAKGAGIGAGIYKDNNEAFATLEKLDVIEPNQAKRQEYADAYARWKHRLEKSMAK